MIGKKSKFKEHEQRNLVQNQEDSNGENLKADGSSENAAVENSKPETAGSNRTVENSGIIRTEDIEDAAKFASEYAPLETQPEGSSNSEEVQRVEAQTQEDLSKLDILRSEPDLQTTSGENSVSTSSQQKIPGSTPTIIKVENIKSDSELLWDEICNGVVGKNSGIPMGFNRLNKYLGLRKSIYTTIGAAAG